MKENIPQLVERDFENRPWGSYRVLHREAGLWVKRIEVNPGARLSLQKHGHRSEKWVVVAGSGVSIVDGKEIPVRVGSFVDVPCHAVHRMWNTGIKPLVFVEVALGEHLVEADIERLQDDFGR